MKHKLIFVFFIMLIFIASCQTKPKETTPLNIPEAQKQSENKNIDLCAEVDLMNKDLASLYKDMDNAEQELEGLKVDLEYAKQDNSDAAELENLVKNQEDYIAKINGMINDLQKAISEC